MDPEVVKALRASKDINSQEYKIVNPRLNAMARLNQSIDGRLLEDPSRSEDERAKSYAQALEDFLTFKNQYVRETTQPVEYKLHDTQTALKKGISSVELGKTVPKHLRTKAERLADLLRESGKIAWDEQNRLIVDGKPVEGTNIIDLINDALRRRKTFVPPGRRTFADQLRHINAPRELVGNADYWRDSGSAAASSHDEFDTPLKTPRSQKRTVDRETPLKSPRSAKARRKLERKRQSSLADIDWSTEINM